MELLCDSRHGVYIPQIMARRLYDAAADRSAERGPSMEFCLSGSLAKTARALWAQGKYTAADHVWRRAMQALINEREG